mmetsp:Transcript_7012/g.17309  ORF Transcript_7012/g.17309 Transcript_7012/m.17309 type:complete len:530 (+) Transcript_7012:28-1617(+)
MTAAAHHVDRILVVDFGSQVSHLICRRCRETGVYSELRSCVTPLAEMQSFGPKGVILSGGPNSVYEADSPHVPEGFWKWVEEKNLPVLGICYGLQEMVHALGGKVESHHRREYGRTALSYPGETRHHIFDGCAPHSVVWMSHGDKCTALPEKFHAIATSDNSEFAAIAHESRPLIGVQFHPEVTHTEEGTKIIRNFCCAVAGLPEGAWNMELFAEEEIVRLRKLVGDRPVIGAVSGGVDSTVVAALLTKAVGKQFHPFLIDTGMMRLDECREVMERLKGEIEGLNLKVIDRSQEFFEALKGVSEPEKKRKIIGKNFIDSFDKAVADMGLKDQNCFLLQGTLYPDVIESTSYRGPSTTIKTHHNVGGLPEKMHMEVLEPLRLLFKDEVRALGRQLGLSAVSIDRHPFPGPGLAIRIMGEATPEHAIMLRAADHIFIEELRKAGVYNDVGQAFVVLMPGVRSVGVMGDQRTYEHVCCLRAVQTTDFMTADWCRLDYDLLGKVSNRIINEVKGINRVCYDVSSKPPATIEWE